MRLPMQGVCSKFMDIEIEDGIIKSLNIIGGCDGNLKGIAQLAVGAKAEDVAKNLQGITCGRKNTSCPDQIAKGIEIYLKVEAKKAAEAEA